MDFTNLPSSYDFNRLAYDSTQWMACFDDYTAALLSSMYCQPQQYDKDEIRPSCRFNAQQPYNQLNYILDSISPAPVFGTMDDFIDSSIDLRSDCLLLSDDSGIESQQGTVMLEFNRETQDPPLDSYVILPENTPVIDCSKLASVPQNTVRHNGINVIEANAKLSSVCVGSTKRKRVDDVDSESRKAKRNTKNTILETAEEQKRLNEIVSLSTEQNVNGRMIYVCYICHKQYTRRSNLRIHGRTHINCQPYSCSFCDKTFTRRSNWLSHEARHTGTTVYSCSVCAKGFVDWSTWKRHERTHI